MAGHESSIKCSEGKGRQHHMSRAGPQQTSSQGWAAPKGRGRPAAAEKQRGEGGRKCDGQGRAGQQQKRITTRADLSCPYAAALASPLTAVAPPPPPFRCCPPLGKQSMGWAGPGRASTEGTTRADLSCPHAAALPSLLAAVALPRPFGAAPPRCFSAAAVPSPCEQLLSVSFLCCSICVRPSTSAVIWPSACISVSLSASHLHSSLRSRPDACLLSLSVCIASSTLMDCDTLPCTQTHRCSKERQIDPH